MEEISYKDIEHLNFNNIQCKDLSLLVSYVNQARHNLERIENILENIIKNKA